MRKYTIHQQNYEALLKLRKLWCFLPVCHYNILVLVTAQINYLVVKAVSQQHTPVKYNWQLTNQSTGEI